MPLGHCYRCHSVVEPALSPQWFVRAKPLAEPAMAAVREKRTRIIPEHWERTYFEWMENIRDWCISRQIWWGHQIPAWYCRDCNGERVSEVPAARRDSRRRRGNDAAHRGRRRADRQPGAARALPDLRRRAPRARPRRPRHLVLLGALALLDARVAGAHAIAGVLLPDLGARDELRHPLFLGGPHDDDGPQVHGRSPVPGRLHPRPRARRRRSQDVQVARQRHRPARDDGALRHRRLPLHADGPRRPGARHQARRGADRRLPQLRDQALERLAPGCDEPRGPRRPRGAGAAARRDRGPLDPLAPRRARDAG